MIDIIRTMPLELACLGYGVCLIAGILIYRRKRR